MQALPKIRDDIEAIPMEEEPGMFLLYDRSGLSEAQLAVSAGVMLVADYLDGVHSALDICHAYQQATSEQLPVEELNGIVQNFDQSLFMLTPDFEAFRANIEQEFSETAVREPCCAGGAYPDNPGELSAMLQLILTQAPPVEDSGRVTNAPRPAPRGVIAPHMDYSRAGECYGQVYRELAKFNPPQTVVILGTAHQKLPHRFSLCCKDFQTPLGTVEYDRDMAERFLQTCAPVADFREGVLAHRLEHSIELQLVWLKHIWGDKVKILPVLVGEVSDFIANPQAAGNDLQFDAVCTFLQSEMERRRGEVLLLASADLAHIGPRFGDERQVDEAFLNETEKADREYLQAVQNGEGAAGLRSLHRHDDLYHICGTGCIYILNRCLPQITGRMLGYSQAYSPEMHQAVTCAGMIFE